MTHFHWGRKVAHVCCMVRDRSFSNEKKNNLAVCVYVYVISSVACGIDDVKI